MQRSTGGSIIYNCIYMPKSSGKITLLLKHIAELVAQNQALREENDNLLKENEKFSQEIDRYRKALREKHSELEKRQNAERNKTTVRYKTASVLFADFQGFEYITSQSETDCLVDYLDEMTMKIQEIISKYNIQNIKTFGDTVMCVGGIPKKNLTNPVQVLLAAVEMQYFVMDFQHAMRSNKIWKLRIGIHTGSVTASMEGGRKRQHYEVQGETVNLATRIRNLCPGDQILISDNTFELVKEFFTCEYFGKIPVKYRGNLQLYAVRGIKPSFSLKGRGIIPNRNMSIRIGMMQFMDLQEIILDRLERELPQGLYYHNSKHTVDVVTQAELIGLGENITDEELLLVKTAALFHDTGHIIAYDNHEHYSTVIAREMLEEFNYTQPQIEVICELIMATQLPPRPSGILQEIMCDADLDYLGRSDMIPVSNTLFMELKERNRIGSLDEWNRLQIKFISGHQYFTATARNLREVNKQKQIERIRDLLVESTVAAG